MIIDPKLTNPTSKTGHTKQLFSVPVFVKDVALDVQQAITAEIDAKIEAIRSGGPTIRPFGGTVESTFCYGQQDVAYHDLRQLNEAVNVALMEYLIDEEYQDPQTGFRVTETWFNFNKPHGLALQHSHIGRRLHIIYYYKSNGEDGDLELMHPIPHCANGHFPYDSPIEILHRIKPKIGRIVIMPAWLEHRVGENTTQDERISICFNLV